MTATPDIDVVRQHTRHACSRPAVLWARGDSAAQVVVARAGVAGAVDGGVAVTVVDVSLGGVGVHSPVFFPRGCCVEVSVEGGGRVAVRVLRALMTNRTPRYYLGLGIDGANAEATGAIERLVSLAAPTAGTVGGTDAR